MASTTHSLSTMASKSSGSSLYYGLNNNNSNSGNSIRVLIPNDVNGSIASKSFPITPAMTVRDVSKLVAHRMRVTNPEDHGLYTLQDGVGECPDRDLGRKLSRFVVHFPRVWRKAFPFGFPQCFAFCRCPTFKA